MKLHRPSVLILTATTWLGALPFAHAASGDSAPFVLDTRNFSGSAAHTVHTDKRAYSTMDTVPGSLRQAIANAAAGEAVDFDSGLSGGTITLGGTQLLIDKDLTIDASAITDGVTVSGIGTHVVFNVAAGNVVAMRSISITGGLIGIVNYGTASLDECAIYDNHYTGWGGGAYNEGTLTITNSTLAENSAQHGGGIFIQNGSVSLTHVTISANEATTWGGGVIQNGGTFQLNNTIIAGNTASVGANTYIVNSYMATGSNLTSGDPLLAPLGNYGGPTQTMPPLPGSPAIEGAPSTTLPSDQRGSPRPSGPLPDIGAVEAFPFSTISLVDTDSDGIDDRLEEGIFGNTGVADASSDTDGDGSSDKDEIANMTNPLDPSDYFRILSFTKAAGFTPTNPLFDITWTSFPGLDYQLEHQSDLSSPFDGLGSPATATDFTTTLEVTLDPGKDFVRPARK